MRKRLGLGVACVLAVVLGVVLYPVEGVIWRASQVERLALVRGELRSETAMRAAIDEALGGVRADRFRRLFRRDCHPLELEFLTSSGWVASRVECPGGFFLDFVPRPESTR